MPDSQRYPLNRYRINNVRDIGVLLSWKMFNSHNFTFKKNPQLEIINKNQIENHGYLIQS